MDIPQATQEKIQKLQLYEQKIQALLAQRQEVESSLSEIDSALEALNNSKEKESFKIIGNVMILQKNSEIKTELEMDKKKVDLRIKNLEKQENELKSVAEAMQKEVLKQIEGKK